jgi:cytochrome c oxidase subunit 4
MSEHHIAPKSMYFTIFGALMALTFITVAVSYVDLGRANVLVALAVAGVKATLVVLWFMHVKHNTPLIKLTVATGFLWLIFMFSITFSDYISRGFLGWPQSWGATGTVVHHDTPPPGVVVSHDEPATGHEAPSKQGEPKGQ